jgi:hypothetical protein
LLLGLHAGLNLTNLLADVGLAGRKAAVDLRELPSVTVPVLVPLVLLYERCRLLSVPTVPPLTTVTV